jgi:hypothetical protein
MRLSPVMLQSMPFMQELHDGDYAVDADTLQSAEMLKNPCCD